MTGIVIRLEMIVLPLWKINASFELAALFINQILLNYVPHQS
jgi:hypothetical protein